MEDITSLLLKEVRDIQRFLQDWFNGAVPDRDDVFSRLQEAWDPNFVVVTPQGSILRREGMMDALRGAYGSKSHLRIHLGNFQVHHVCPSSALQPPLARSCSAGTPSSKKSLSLSQLRSSNSPPAKSGGGGRAGEGQGKAGGLQGGLDDWRARHSQPPKARPPALGQPRPETPGTVGGSLRGSRDGGKARPANNPSDPPSFGESGENPGGGEAKRSPLGLPEVFVHSPRPSPAHWALRRKASLPGHFAYSASPLGGSLGSPTSSKSLSSSSGGGSGGHSNNKEENIRNSSGSEESYSFYDKETETSDYLQQQHEYALYHSFIPPAEEQGTWQVAICSFDEWQTMDNPSGLSASSSFSSSGSAPSPGFLRRDSPDSLMAAMALSDQPLLSSPETSPARDGRTNNDEPNRQHPLSSSQIQENGDDSFDAQEGKNSMGGAGMEVGEDDFPAPGQMVKKKTAVFLRLSGRSSQVPYGVRWLHVHETWISSV